MDRSQFERRPAVVLAGAGRGEFVLCQVTSNAYADPRAIELSNVDFSRGPLQRASFVRSGKLFTPSRSLIVREVGALPPATHARVIAAVVRMLQRAASR